MHIPQAACEKLRMYQHRLQVCKIDIKVTQETTFPPIFPPSSPHSLLSLPNTSLVSVSHYVRHAFLSTTL